MSVTIDADDPRTIRALELAAAADQWLVCRTGDGREAYRVPSQGDADRSYLVTSSSCDCPDFSQNGLSSARLGEAGMHRACKHILAVRLHDELVRAQRQQPSRPSPPRGQRSHLRLVPTTQPESPGPAR